METLEAIARLAWIPILTALIGWGTNWLAIRMLFRPHEPHKVLGLTVQGLLPRRRMELAEKVAEVIERELLSQHVIREELDKIDVHQYVDGFIKRVVREKLGVKLQKIPLIGSFVNDSTLGMLERAALEAVHEEIEPMREHLADDLESHLQVKEIVRTRIETYEIQHLENVVLEVARRELRAIEWLGAVLGFLVGVGQVGVLVTLG